MLRARLVATSLIELEPVLHGWLRAQVTVRRDSHVLVELYGHLDDLIKVKPERQVGFEEAYEGLVDVGCLKIGLQNEELD